MRTFTVAKEPHRNPLTVKSTNAGEKFYEMLSSGHDIAVTLKHAAAVATWTRPTHNQY